jgi:hypothetical protein
MKKPSPEEISQDVYQQTKDLVSEGHVLPMYIAGSSASDSFSYSLGFLQHCNHPELITFGLPLDTTKIVFHLCRKWIKANGPLPTNKKVSGIAPTFDLWFAKLNQEVVKDYVLMFPLIFPGRALDYLQLVWPDNKNRFPWEADCEGISLEQSQLYKLEN